MLKPSVISLLLVAWMLPAGAEAAGRSSLDAGFKLAAKRGYSGDKANCVANVFARNATVGPRGGWQVGGSAKNIAAYQSDLRRSCGVKG